VNREPCTLHPEVRCIASVMAALAKLSNDDLAVQATNDDATSCKRCVPQTLPRNICLSMMIGDLLCLSQLTEMPDILIFVAKRNRKRKGKACRDFCNMYAYVRTNVIWK